MLCNIKEFIPRRERSDLIVVNVRERFRSRPGICRELMDRREPNSLIVGEDRFRSVAVMAVKIPNRNAFRAFFQHIERSNGNVTKITETHGSIGCGVMPG